MTRLDKLPRLLQFVVLALTAVFLNHEADAVLPMTDQTPCLLYTSPSPRAATQT